MNDLDTLSLNWLAIYKQGIFPYLKCPILLNIGHTVNLHQSTAIPLSKIFWQQHVSQWQKSNLSQAQYCKKHNLKSHSLSHHKRKLETKHKKAPSSGFIKVAVPQTLEVQTPLTLHFASGLSLSGIEHGNIGLVKQLTAILA